MNIFDPNLRISDDDGNDITALVHKRMLDGTYMREIEAEEKQRAVQRQLGVQKYNRKLGMMPLMNITPEVYWHWVAREGFDCWGDDGFRRDLMRDNPELKARVEMPADRVSFAGLNGRFANVPLIEGRPQDPQAKYLVNRTPNKRGQSRIQPATNYTRLDMEVAHG